MEGREVGVNNNAHTIKYTFICAIECATRTLCLIDRRLGGGRKIKSNSRKDGIDTKTIHEICTESVSARLLKGWKCRGRTFLCKSSPMSQSNRTL